MQYNPDFVVRRPILSDEDKHLLQSLIRAYPLNSFRADERNYEEMTVDFVYTSAKIEGNTYDRIDTDNLLRRGVTADGKRYSDAVMLVNLRNGFEQVMGIEPSTPLDFDYLCDLHKVLMRDLLRPDAQGLGRQGAVQIGATTYKPLADPMRLRTEIKFILSESEKYSDVIEQAIYLHCNVAYLQYFKDGNKRTARMMQTAALVRGGLLPLFFSDILISKYIRSTVDYYETGDYTPYVGFFIENYRLVVTHLLGHEP
ncbi:MAG: Fic family protein [Rhodocyclaceae bacterium]|nr:Fic family protein [Rhodocyclaceae bacterium]